MKNYLLKAQSIVVYAIEVLCLALFVLFLGFMTNFYALFYDGTLEMFEFYKKLQVFNKEAFNLALLFIVFALALLVFRLHKYRPGLFGLVLALITTVFVAMNSFFLLQVVPLYKAGYLALDFSSMEDYVPSTFVFDASMVLLSTLIVILVIFAIIAILAFVQRIREGNPVIRRLIV